LKTAFLAMETCALERRMNDRFVGGECRKTARFGQD